MTEVRPVLADLHVHTVLSACAEVEMIPPLIVRRALELGLGVIGITDHNACGNAGAVMSAAERTGLVVLPGMELQTREEVHLLCLFGALEAAEAWEKAVWARLPALENREDFFGAQFVVDRAGRHVRTEGRLLQVSADISLEDAIAGVHRLGGLAIPAHIDRPSFSLLGNLGLVPPRLAADALEVSGRWRPLGRGEGGGGPSGEKRGQSTRDSPRVETWPLIRSGDAHRLPEMAKRTILMITNSTFMEIEKAIRGKDGRSVKIEWNAEGGMASADYELR